MAEASLNLRKQLHHLPFNAATKVAIFYQCFQASFGLFLEDAEIPLGLLWTEWLETSHAQSSYLVGLFFKHLFGNLLILQEFLMVFFVLLEQDGVLLFCAFQMLLRKQDLLLFQSQLLVFLLYLLVFLPQSFIAFTDFQLQFFNLITKVFLPVFQPAESFSDRLQLKLQLIEVSLLLHQILQLLLILGEQLILLPYNILILVNLHLKVLLLIDSCLYFILGQSSLQLAVISIGSCKVLAQSISLLFFFIQALQQFFLDRDFLRQLFRNDLDL